MSLDLPRKSITVVHLVRAANGVKPLRDFLDSYCVCSAGAQHELMFVLKGFKHRTLSREYEDQLGRCAHRRIFVGDWGYDITAYFRAARETNSGYLIFLNSFSRILEQDWLAKMHAVAKQPGVGLVGATGSHQGTRVDLMNFPRMIKLAERAKWKQIILDIPKMKEANKIRLRALARFARLPLFPNPHVRTNAFMLQRDLLLRLTPQTTVTKRSAYLFEHGRNGMTRQVLRAGLRPVVVGRDGQSFEMAQWCDSNTFWCNGQDNLLVSDNQTRNYETVGSSDKALLTWLAWGFDASPSDVTCSTPQEQGTMRHIQGVTSK